MKFVNYMMFCLSLLAFAASAQDEKFGKTREPLTLLNDGSDGGAIAVSLVRTFLNEEQWQSEVKKLRSRYDDWQHDNRNGSIGQYLDDRLIICALAASGGKVDKVQKGIMWLAFYKEFNQQQPAIVSRFLREHKGSMTRLFDKFNWEKASEYVKNKEWRTDLDGAAPAAAPAAHVVEVTISGSKAEEVVIPSTEPSGSGEELSLSTQVKQVSIPEETKTVAAP